MQTIKNTSNQKVPQHIAIVMDGNRRWAKQKGKNASTGHLVGYERFKEIADACLEKGVKILTVYAFSTENWKRSKAEVAALLRILETALKREAKRLMKNNVQFRTIGDLSKFPKSLQNLIAKIKLDTKNNTKGIFNLALNYGAQAEITNAVKKLLKKGIKAEELTEEIIEQNLYTTGERNPDLIIRTGGCMRLSNFLLWQAAYSELYFTKILWPDFTVEELDKALADFALRKRNFGR